MVYTIYYIVYTVLYIYINSNYTPYILFLFFFIFIVHSLTRYLKLTMINIYKV